MRWRRMKHLFGIHYWVPYLEYHNGMVLYSGYENCHFCTKTRRDAIR